MKDISAYNNFLENAVLFPTNHWLEHDYNNNGPLLPDQKESTDEKDYFKNFTHKGYTSEGIVILGSTHGVYYESKKAHKSNDYEVYIYEINNDKSISVTKIEAKMGYRKTLLGKPNYKKPVIKINTIKASKVTKENEELYIKINEHINKVKDYKVIEKKRLDYALEHSGEEYERQLKADYFNNPWR